MILLIECAAGYQIGALPESLRRETSSLRLLLS
jgi:hypothetical protein